MELVSLPAVLPDLAVRSSERLNITHFDHCSHKISAKSGWITAVSLDESVGGAATKQLLVRV